MVEGWFVDCGRVGVEGGGFGEGEEGLDVVVVVFEVGVGPGEDLGEGAVVGVGGAEGGGVEADEGGCGWWHFGCGGGGGGVIFME